MGFGAEVAAVLQEQAFDWLDAPIERVGAKFAPLAFAPAMEQFVIPQPADVLAAIRRTVAASMATEVKLPRLGQGMEAGTIVKWLKAEGDRVEKGEPLYEVDTDKVTQEVEAEASGVLLKIAVASGEVPVGRDVAVIGEAGEDVPAKARRRRPEPEAGAAERAVEPAPSRDARARPRRRGRGASLPRRAAMHGSSTGGGVKASPLARRIARERGIELVGATRHRAGRADRRRGRRARRAAAPAARRGSPRLGAARRGRVGAADERPQDDRAPADRGLDGARLRAHRLGRHDARRTRWSSARASCDPTSESPSPTCS